MIAHPRLPSVAVGTSSRARAICASRGSDDGVWLCISYSFINIYGITLRYCREGSRQFLLHSYPKDLLRFQVWSLSNKGICPSQLHSIKTADFGLWEWAVDMFMFSLLLLRCLAEKKGGNMWKQSLKLRKGRVARSNLHFDLPGLPCSRALGRSGQEYDFCPLTFWRGQSPYWYSSLWP